MRTTLFALGTAVLVAAAAPVLADRPLPPITNDAVSKECGECHMAYQPQFLPRASWRKMMDTLPDHFGEDASLDPVTAGNIRRYLEDNAAHTKGNSWARKYTRARANGAPLLRISDTRHWRHEHDELPKEAWSDPRVRSKARCDACHIGAKAGDYEEDNVRVPGPNNTWINWDD